MARPANIQTQALGLARQLGDRRGETLALRGLGDVGRLVGEYDRSREYHTQALALARQLGDRHGEAAALWRLGHVTTGTEERGETSELWRKALGIYEELGLPLAEDRSLGDEPP
jgi:tetratricopeptide repeat protein